MASKRSIGQVLSVLKAQFPDISISKIRFLESEGLVSPERAPSGYRKYSDADVERLRYILRVQKDQYLPLKVIRDHLDALDSGRPVPAAATTAEPPAPTPEPADVRRPAEPMPQRMNRAELLRRSGLPESTLVELERLEVIAPSRGTGAYSANALTVALAARRLAEFGMDTRHLRAFCQLAEREAGVIEATVAPYSRRGPEQFRSVRNEVVKVVSVAHAALLRSALER